MADTLGRSRRYPLYTGFTVIYMSDLAQALSKCEVKLYADDTFIFYFH